MGCFASSQKDDDQSIQLQSAKKLKVVIVGLEGSGKTSILQFIKNGHFTQTQPTIGLNVETIIFKQRNYLVFDVGGKVRSLWAHYYENLDGLVFVVDSCDKDRLKVVREELEKLNKDLIGQNVVKLVYFTKSELNDALQNQDLLEQLNLTNQTGDVIIQRCSSVNGSGIWEGIDKMNSLLDVKFKT